MLGYLRNDVPLIKACKRVGSGTACNLPREEFRVTCMAIPGSLAGVGDGMVFGLAGERLLYFNTTITVKLPLFFLAGSDTKAAATTLYVILTVLPVFLLTVCRGGKRPLRIVVQRFIRIGFLHPGRQPCRAGGFCATLTQRRQLSGRMQTVIGKGKGSPGRGTWACTTKGRASQHTCPTIGKQQRTPCNTKRRAI